MRKLDDRRARRYPRLLEASDVNGRRKEKERNAKAGTRRKTSILEAGRAPPHRWARLALGLEAVSAPAAKSAVGRKSETDHGLVRRKGEGGVLTRLLLTLPTIRAHLRVHDRALTPLPHLGRIHPLPDLDPALRVGARSLSPSTMPIRPRRAIRPRLTLRTSTRKLCLLQCMRRLLLRPSLLLLHKQHTQLKVRPTLTLSRLGVKRT